MVTLIQCLDMHVASECIYFSLMLVGENASFLVLVPCNRLQ